MRSRIIVYAFIAGLFCLLFVFSCKQKAKDGKVDTAYASLVDTNKYIGKDACKKCHSDKYETFVHTGMGLSFDSATVTKTSGRFSKHEVIYDKFSDFSYYPHFENGKFIITEFRLKNKDTLFIRKESVSYIVGSGQHTNSHLINSNGYVYQAPATFYTQSGKWDLPPGFENGYNSRFSRVIEMECMSCHNAFPKMVLGSANKYENIPSGIDCERCHGPGSIHKAQKEQGLIVDVGKEIDYSIVNPAKLETNKQMDVCQRCHVQGNAVLRKGKSFLDFKPGMDLSEVMNVFMPVYKGDDDQHIMASHAERLKMSKCFLESVKIITDANRKNPDSFPFKNSLTCITCHNPHVSVKSTNKEVFNSACKSCHHSEGEKEGVNPIVASVICTEKMEKRKIVSDNCVSCHMPKNGTIDIPHVTTTDHWIRKIIAVQKTNAIREFVRLSCINNSHVEKNILGEAYLNYFEKFVSNKSYLDSAKKYLDDKDIFSVSENFQDLVRWAFLKNDYSKVIEYCLQIRNNLDSLIHKSFSNADAWTAYRIGEAYRKENKFDQALVYFDRAVSLAPFIPDFRLKLADLQFDINDLISAEKNYLFILKENPKNVSANVNYGYLIMSWKKDVAKATFYYSNALKIDPDNIQAILNLAGISLYSGNNQEARKLLLKVLKIDPINAEAKKYLKIL